MVKGKSISAAIARRLLKIIYYFINFDIKYKENQQRCSLSYFYSSAAMGMESS